MTLFKSFHRTTTLILLLTLSACGLPSTPAALTENCTLPGSVTATQTLDNGYLFQVYLPPCFSAATDAKYPVLYLIPGRGGSPESWFEAGLAHVVDQEILNQSIPPLIIITTETTDNDPMAEVIYKELIPYAEDQYPIIKNRKYRAAAGGSLGGVAAYRLAFQYPDTFSSAGMFGSGAISGEEKQIHAWLSAMNDKNQTRVFMDSGILDPLMLDRAKVMKSILDEHDVENKLFSGKGGHEYGYWVNNFGAYLKWLAETW